MDPEKWESLDILALNKNAGVMCSNLPLLFAKGLPTHLEKMTQVILFWVKC